MDRVEQQMADMEARMMDEVEAFRRQFEGRGMAVATLAKELEPVRREAAERAKVAAIESTGKVVKDKKPARMSGTINASITGAVAAVYAAWELFPGAMTTGEWDTFGAAAGAAVTALVALWRRYKVGDLEVWK